MSTHADERIRASIDELVADTLVVDPVDLAAVVRDGVVTLEGTVNDDAERTAIAARVRDVAGVRDVENRLRTRAQSPG